MTHRVTVVMKFCAVARNYMKHMRASATAPRRARTSLALSRQRPLAR
jgi:hypothetical protein